MDQNSVSTNAPPQMQLKDGEWYEALNTTEKEQQAKTGNRFETMSYDEKRSFEEDEDSKLIVQVNFCGLKRSIDEIYLVIALLLVQYCMPDIFLTTICWIWVSPAAGMMAFGAMFISTAVTVLLGVIAADLENADCVDKEDNRPREIWGGLKVWTLSLLVKFVFYLAVVAVAKWTHS